MSTTTVPSSVDEHLDAVLTGLQPLEPLELVLAEAQGTLLAADVYAPLPLPAFDQATVDGWAVRVADVAAVPATLAVVPDAEVVRPGVAVRVGAGRPLPAGTEAVVPAWEAVPQAGSPHVELRGAVVAGQHLRRTGEDLGRDDLALHAGTLLGPTQIGLLASLGLARASVHPRPRVTVLAVGDALAEPGGALPGGGQYDATSHALAAACRDAGATAYRLPAVRPDEGAVAEAVEDHLIQSDAVLVIADVHATGYDPVGEVLSRLGEVRLRRVAMRPAPLHVHGRIGPDRTPVFVVPAQTVPALVSFEVFVRPALRRLLGAEAVGRPQVRVMLEAPLDSPRGERQYVRAQVRHDPTRGWLASPQRPGEQALSALAASNALVVVPELMTTVPAGTGLSALLLERRQS